LKIRSRVYNSIDFAAKSIESPEFKKNPYQKMVMNLRAFLQSRKAKNKQENKEFQKQLELLEMTFKEK